MALSPRIVTRNTPLLAIVLAATILGFAWFAAELVPSRDVTSGFTPTQMRSMNVDPVQSAASSFAPSDIRPDARLCGWTADQVHRHFEAMTADNVEMRARAISGLTEAYLDLECPSRIHDGDWYMNAEILGVGLAVESLQGQPWFEELGVRFDERASELVPAATTTFEILAPRQMCIDAARGNPALAVECLEAFGWLY